MLTSSLRCLAIRWSLPPASAALDVVWHSSYLPAQRRNRPLQREAFIYVKFTPSA
jgi:hypothetical protein